MRREDETEVLAVDSPSDVSCGRDGRGQRRLDDAGPSPGTAKDQPFSRPAAGGSSRSAALCRPLRPVPWRECRRQKKAAFSAQLPHTVANQRGRLALASGEREDSPWHALLVPAPPSTALATGQLLEVVENG